MTLPVPPGYRSASLPSKRFELGKRDFVEPLDDLLHRGTAPQDLAGGQDRAPGQRVTEAQLDRVGTKRPSQFVHLSLVRETHLGRSETPHGPTRGVVGVDHGAFHDHVGHFIGTGGEGGGVAHHRRGGRGVGATVEEQPGVDRDQLPVAPGAVPHPDARGVAVHVPVEGLLAPVRELDRPTRTQGQHARVHLHVDVLARAECAAHAGQVQPDLFLGQAQAGCDLLPVDVQPLRGDIYVYPAVLGGHGQPRLGPQRGLVLHGGLVVAVHPDICRRGVGVTVKKMDMAQHVAPFMQSRRVRRHSLFHVVHTLEGFEVERDGPDGVPGREAGAGRDHRDRLSRVTDDVLGQHGLVVEIQPEPVLARNVGGQEDRHHPGGGQCGRDVDAADPGVRNGRPQGRTVEHAVAVKVAGVGEGTLHLGYPVSARCLVADPAPSPHGGRSAGTQIPTSLCDVMTSPISDRTDVGEREGGDVH